MKKGTFISLFLFLAGTGWAQNELPGLVSSQPGTNVSQGATGTSSFTNRAGTVYSTEQLSSQLQKLRSNIEQSLPMLMAYTETVSNAAAASGNRSLAGAVTEILSDVLNRRGNQTNTSGGNFFSTSNVVGVLQGLLAPSTNTSSSINATALKDLADIQTELQSVNTKLQRLNVPGTNTLAPLTPTGR
jgi:hypothetical protein